jgi:hypothetical protein
MVFKLITYKRLMFKKNIIKNLAPTLIKILGGLQKAFLVTNAFACSYLLINIIRFYNITLLYYFLFIGTLPPFLR